MKEKKVYKVAMFLLFSLFTTVSLLGFNSVAKAESGWDGTIEGLDASEPITFDVQSGIYRSSPLFNRKVVLKSGESVQLKLGGYIDKTLYSKYRLKVNVASDDNENVLIRRVGVYPHNGTRKNQFYFSSNKIDLMFNLKNDAIPTNNNVNSGNETFIISNVSATELTFDIGITSGLQLRTGVEDYSDLDFEF